MVASRLGMVDLVSLVVGVHTARQLVGLGAQSAFATQIVGPGRSAVVAMVASRLGMVDLVSLVVGVHTAA